MTTTQRLCYFGKFHVGNAIRATDSSSSISSERCVACISESGESLKNFEAKQHHQPQQQQSKPCRHVGYSFIHDDDDDISTHCASSNSSSIIPRSTMEDAFVALDDQLFQFFHSASNKQQQQQPITYSFVSMQCKNTSGLIPCQCFTELMNMLDIVVGINHTITNCASNNSLFRVFMIRTMSTPPTRYNWESSIPKFDLLRDLIERSRNMWSMQPRWQTKYVVSGENDEEAEQPDSPAFRIRMLIE
jgi:hypothetical protein